MEKAQQKLDFFDSLRCRPLGRHLSCIFNHPANTVHILAHGTVIAETDIVLFAPFRLKKCSDWFSFRKEIGKGSNSECRTSGFGLYNIHAIDDALSLFGQNIQNIVQHFTRYE